MPLSDSWKNPGVQGRSDPSEKINETRRGRLDDVRTEQKTTDGDKNAFLAVTYEQKIVNCLFLPRELIWRRLPNE